MSSDDIQRLMVLWGKTYRGGPPTRCLLWHMIDVASVAHVVWEHSLQPRLKEYLASWLGVSPDDAGRFVAFLAGVHDVGKASPAFQDHVHLSAEMRQQIRSRLQSVGLPVTERLPSEARARHEVISAWSLRPVKGEGLLSAVTGLEPELAGALAQALGGHHGAWPQADRFGPQRLTRHDHGAQAWRTVRSALVSEMARLFPPPRLPAHTAHSLHDDVALVLLTAIVSIADWIGSDENAFPLADNYPSPDACLAAAYDLAEKAVDRAGLAPPPTMPEFQFRRVFPFDLCASQQKIAAVAAEMPLPAIAIIEAPMGVGKTEAALAVYADWARRNGAAGLYIAMPTTATSNQMHERVQKFLHAQVGKHVEPLLVHSQALLRDSSPPPQTLEDEQGEAAAAQTWFLPRKKSLLAPYGVGTVDQALMSVLQTKHFFVRLLGLSHKIVIFDEVHAYDTYMSELFERLLVWLRAVGASVIVLSATLPDRTRQRLIAAYSGSATTAAPCRYPRLTCAAADGNVASHELPPPADKTLGYRWLRRDEGEIIRLLRDALQAGGCAAVMCNTVARAQSLFLALQNTGLCDSDNLVLFHARFPMAWREEIEEKVLRKFGPGAEKGKPNPDRPKRAIVVATQVIEQSLDLDFDIMISDMAPLDLLLQRSGRLHRHTVSDPRPHANCLWIAEPPCAEGLPQFEGSDTYVYEEYVLLRSWLVLKQWPVQSIKIPGDVAKLIESVYGDQDVCANDQQNKALHDARAKMIAEQRDAADQARERLLREPNARDLLSQPFMNLGDEDDPRINPAFRALTRLGDPGVQVVCLHEVNGALHLDPDGNDVAIGTNDLPTEDMILRLARHVIAVRHPDPAVSSALLDRHTDPRITSLLQLWKRSPALRFCRPVIFLNGRSRLANTSYILSLDRNLGLRIFEEDA